MFISTLLVESSKTVVILCCIKLGIAIFMAFTSCCGIVIQYDVTYVLLYVVSIEITSYYKCR